MIVEVILLDGSKAKFDLEGKCTGEDLLTRVSEHINLVEKDYFGFLHVDHRDKTLTWLHMDKSLSKQLKEDRILNFQVKFYPPEPAQLQEDLTRYGIVENVICLNIYQRMFIFDYLGTKCVFKFKMTSKTENCLVHSSHMPYSEPIWFKVNWAIMMQSNMVQLLTT